MSSDDATGSDHGEVTQRHACSLCDYPDWIRDENEGLERWSIEFDRSSFPSLIDHAKHCSGCAILNQGIGYAQRITRENQLGMIGISKAGLAGYVQLYYWAPEEKHGKGPIESSDVTRDNPQYFSVFTKAGDRTVPGVQQGSSIPVNTELENSLSTIRSWMDICASNHEICNQQSDYLPPRLLDLQGHPEVVRLIDTTGSERPSPGSKYACLSHCWGPRISDRLVTTSASLSSHSQGIRINALPQTFKDCVHVCRELGVQYLWIDAICIIQNDEADWRMHVGAMAEIFKSSICTIAAGASLDSRGGLFRRVSSKYMEIGPSDFSMETHDCAVFMRAELAHPFHLTESQWPLTERGWVLQEYLLSPRFIGFGPQEVYWSCYETNHCSCKSPTEPDRDGIRPSGPAHNEMDKIKHSLAMKDERSARELWYSLIETYSGLELTFVEDRFPAIAGLAKIFKAVLSDEYLAGTWRKDVSERLVWANFNATIDPTDDMSPSWMVGPTIARGDAVAFYTLVYNDLFECRDTTVKWGVNGEFDSLASGSITVYGILRRVSIFRNVSSSDPTDRVTGLTMSDGGGKDHDEHAIRLSMTSYGDENSKEGLDNLGDTVKANALMCSFLSDYNLELGSNGSSNLEDVTILIMGNTGFMPHLPDTPERWSAIVLRPRSDEESKTTYRRIGLLNWFQQAAQGEWWGEMLPKQLVTIT